VIGSTESKQLINIIRVSLVEKPLLLKRWVETQQQVGLTVQDLFRKFGISVEVYRLGRVTRMPTYNSVETHYWIWFKDELVFIF